MQGNKDENSKHWLTRHKCILEKKELEKNLGLHKIEEITDTSEDIKSASTIPVFVLCSRGEGKQWKRSLFLRSSIKNWGRGTKSHKEEVRAPENALQDTSVELQLFRLSKGRWRIYLATVHKSFKRRKWKLLERCLHCWERHTHNSSGSSQKNPFVKSDKVIIYKVINQRSKVPGGEDFSSVLDVSKPRLDISMENRSFSLTLQIKGKTKLKICQKHQFSDGGACPQLTSEVAWCWDPSLLSVT